MTLPNLPNNRTLFVLAALLGLGCFFGGVVLGKFMHLAACPLCILQRMCYLGFGLLALSGISLADQPLIRRINALPMLAVAGTGLYIAAYQSWLQWHPEAPSCTANTPWWENFVYWAGDQAPLFFFSSGMCSDPGFTLLGLTIANISSIVFTLLSALALVLLLKKN